MGSLYAVFGKIFENYFCNTRLQKQERQDKVITLLTCSMYPEIATERTPKLK
jgi:hypothetical protein